MQGQEGYPVDNNTYNMLSMVTSKLEALEVYRKYQKDADAQTRPIIDQLIREDEEHARMLLGVLKDLLQKQ
jgi:rubrerythrin